MELSLDTSTAGPPDTNLTMRPRQHALLAIRCTVLRGKTSKKSAKKFPVFVKAGDPATDLRTKPDNCSQAPLPPLL